MTVEELLRRLGEAIDQAAETTCAVYVHAGPDMWPVDSVSVYGEGVDQCVVVRGPEGTFE